MLRKLAHKISVTWRMIKVYRNWPRLIAYRLNLLPQPMIVEVRDGARFRIRGRAKESADAYVVNEMYLYGIHDEMLPIMRHAKVGIDIGAHIGTFSIFAAKNSSAKIYAFEPMPNNLELLGENIELNKFGDRVIPIRKAVASKTGTVDLYVTENSGLVSSFREHAGLYGQRLKGTYRARTTNLPDFFREMNIDFCDFIKVDCEGGEYEIFLNLPQEIYDRIGVMSLEIGGHGDKQGLINHIKDRGFTVSRPLAEFGEYIFKNVKRS